MGVNPKRRDEPGAWHHVMIRAISRRPLFVVPADALRFLELLEKGVLNGELLVHALCMMTNHGHIRIESTEFGLSAAMRNLESVYAREFNEREDRAGSLMQARFRSKRVNSLAYRTSAIRYIHRNPQKAGIVCDGGDYPLSSAFHYRRASGPRWLDRAWVEAYVCRVLGLDAYDPSQFEKVLGAPASEMHARWFETISSSNRPDTAAIDDLFDARPGSVEAWMAARTVIADGPVLLPPVVDVEAVRAAVLARSRVGPATPPRRRGAPLPDDTLMQAGLLRDFAGQSPSSVARTVGISRGSVDHLLRRHDALMTSDETYRAEAIAAASDAIAACRFDPMRS